jgi:hypothetical protein
MDALRSYLACATMVALFPLTAVPAQESGAESKKQPPRTDSRIARFMSLMPAGLEQELQLSSEQRTKIQQLNQEFNQKRLATLVGTGMKVMSIMDSGKEKAEPAPVLAIVHEITGALLETRRSRVGFEKKMLAVLSDEQKVTYENWKEHPPNRRLKAGKKHASEAVSLFSSHTQDKLQLNEEQKKKVSALEKELRAILTDEQRVQYDQLTRDPTAPPAKKDRKAKRKSK